MRSSVFGALFFFRPSARPPLCELQKLVFPAVLFSSARCIDVYHLYDGFHLPRPSPCTPSRSCSCRLNIALVFLLQMGAEEFGAKQEIGLLMGHLVVTLSGLGELPLLLVQAWSISRSDSCPSVLHSAETVGLD